MLGTLKDDEPPVLHSQTKPIVETPSSSGTSLSKVSKTTEDKSESSKGKRHRRTRTAQDGPPVVPEEEKKVNIFYRPRLDFQESVMCGESK